MTLLTHMLCCTWTEFIRGTGGSQQSKFEGFNSSGAQEGLSQDTLFLVSGDMWEPGLL